MQLSSQRNTQSQFPRGEVRLDFKIDENLPVDVAQLLREAGHSVSTVLEEGLGGCTDDVVAKVCQEENRVLVTLDGGFADIRTYPPVEYAGIIVLRLQRHDKPHVLQAWARAIEILATEPISGKLWIVEERRVRVRS
jgi:predicted nuclease of predicted toxin-antitoxin system